MLYSEFLAGTGAVDNEESYKEYKRVEAIYMESSLMTKEYAYRMARVITVKEHEKQMKKARKAEIEWVMQNIIPAAAFIRGMAVKDGSWSGMNYWHRTSCGNLFELKLNREINGYSVLLYDFFVNGKRIDTSESGYKVLPSAEFLSYRANWHDKSRDDLEALFGYIA
ncbi:MAG: hypothetical protein E7449_01125 [Ruminococcaceae bacterium]|nr:hypothetical protein [Oscillospiraceae bacterium]